MRATEHVEGNLGVVWDSEGSERSPVVLRLTSVSVSMQEERNNVEKQLRYQCRCSFLEVVEVA